MPEPIGQVAIIVRTKKNTNPAILIDKFETGKIKDFVILEAGTVSGKTTVALHIKLQNDKSVIVETSYAIFESLYHSMKGADKRFKDGLPTVEDEPLEVTFNKLLQINSYQIDLNLISDGKNTFGDLYELLKQSIGYLNHPGAQLSSYVNIAIDELREKIISKLK